MSRDFYLLNPTFDIPTLSQLRTKWYNVKDCELREIIVIEDQYLSFFKFILQNLRHTVIGHINNPDIEGKPITASIRVMAIKSALISSCCIMETVLLAHAIQRNYKLPKKPYERTFGKIIAAWENDEFGKNELGKHLNIIKAFKKMRDNVHLPKIPREDPNFYEELLNKEQKYLAVAEKMVEFLRNIENFL